MIGSSANKLANAQASAPKHPITSRCRNWLARTAFAGGVFALTLAANPQSAEAVCFTFTGSSDVVNCNTTSTFNPPDLDPSGPHLAREYIFDNGANVTATVTGTVSRRGLAIYNESSGAGINLTNTGTIELESGTTTNLSGGSGIDNAVLSLISNGGSINYSGNGAVIDNSGEPSKHYDGIDIYSNGGAIGVNITAGGLIEAGGMGLVADASKGSDEGGIVTIQNAGTILALEQGIRAISNGPGVVAFGIVVGPVITVDNTGTIASGWTSIRTEATGGGSTVISNSGELTSEFGYGIHASATDGGDISITNSGNILYAGEGGIRAWTAGASGLPGGGLGNITIVNSGNMGSPFDFIGGRGIDAASGGLLGTAINITNSGIILSEGRAISASEYGGGAILIANSGGLATEYGQAAIVARASGGGDILISNTGGIDAFAPWSDAIKAWSDGGDISISNSAVLGVTAAIGNDGIDAAAGGSGSILISNTAAGAIFAGGDGIHAWTSGGSITVNNAATLSVGGRGIDVASGGDSGTAISITNSGDIYSEGRAINASQYGGGSITIVNSGYLDTEYGRAAIFARASGGGAVTINNSGGGIDAPAPWSDAIKVWSDGGDISITNSAVLGVSAAIGHDGIDAATGGGNITITNTLSGTITAVHDGIYAWTSGGSITINNAAAISVDGDGIRVATGGNDTKSISITNSGTIFSADGNGIDATAYGGASVTVTTTANVTGDGDGIRTQTTSGSNTVTVGSGVVVTGVNPGASGISAQTATGAITVDVDTGATVTNATGIGVRLRQTGTTGSAVLNNFGTVSGEGNATWNPVIAIESGGGPTTINNEVGATITSVLSSPAGKLAVDASGGSVTINNAGLLFGGVALSGVTETIDNTGRWTVFGTNSLTGTTNNIINNAANGVIDIGDAAGATSEATSFSSATHKQTVTNAGTINVEALVPHGSALSFTGANTSTFTNSGLINMQADGGATTNAVTLNTSALAGTSDLNYTYTWAGTLATKNYNFVGSGNSTLAVDTFLGAPGSTSDRLVVGGNISGTTQLLVNNTNTGPGAFNPVGITVAAVQGSGSNNIVVSPSSPGYVNFGPLGAIAPPGLFVDALLYVPGGATSTGGLPNGNAYKFFGVPEPFAFNLAVAHTALDTIWQTTALSWEDRQNELRSYLRDGIVADSRRLGGGADMAMKGDQQAASTNPAFWFKVIGADMNRTASVSYAGALGMPILGALGNVDNSYSQTIYAAVGGFDFGKERLTSPADSLMFEIMAGYITSQVGFSSQNMLAVPASVTHFAFSGGTVGVSVDYVNRGFFIDNLVKADFFSLNILDVPAGFLGAGVGNQAVNANIFGDIGNVGYHYQLGRYFLEPLGSWMVSWDRIGTLTLPGAAVAANFSNGQAILAGGGIRGGGVVLDDRVHYLEATVTARVWDRLEGNTDVTFVPIGAGTQFTLNDPFNGPFGQVGLGFDWFNRGSGWSAFVNLDSWFNNQFTLFSYKGGVRYQF